MGATGIPSTYFSVLGPLRARRASTDLDLGSPQQRAVAAVLVLRHGRAVSMDDLVGALWESPPQRPAAVVRTYIWRLRHLLEPEHTQGQPWRLLQSVPGGYSLRLADGALDWELFEERVAEARARKAAGETASARHLFDQALALWQGTTLMGVPGPFADAERSRLEERRLDVIEARLETMVELGACADAATDLTTLVETHPLREGLHYLLMLALHQTGRQGEALAAYRRVHRLLAQELGIEPNARLQQLHDDILQRTAPSVSTPEVVTRQERAPRQIPHAVPDFTGRAEETERIRATLLNPSPEAVPIVLVTGMGGVGKTSLVMHSVRTVLSAYPDGQLYVDLRGADGAPADPAAVLASFLRALGERDPYIPADVAERAALYRSRLAQRRVLVVLDNAADMQQVVPLLPGAPTCAVIITSRNGLATLPVSLRIVLGAMPDDVAMQLFARLIGTTRVNAEPHTAHRILAACGGLPLAVRIVGSRLAARPEWTLADLAGRLADERHRLSELTVDTVTVEASFALGYGQLDPATGQALRLLALPAHGVYDLRTASAVLDMPSEMAKGLLERLVAVGLLESPALDRYRYHDLVRLFARRLALEADTDRTRHATLGRLLDQHLVAAAESYRVMRPGHTVARPTLPQVPGETRFDSVSEALAWSASSLDDILMLLTQTASSHTDRAATLLLLLDAVLMNAHLWHQVIPAATLVADAASLARDSRSEGRARYILSGALAQVGRLNEAEDQVNRALEASRDSEADVHALSLNVKAFIVGHSDPERAIRLFREAASLARTLGNHSLEALVLGNGVQTRLRIDGMDDQTVRDSLRHKRLYRQLGDRQGEAFARYRHGQVLARLGLLDDAMAAYQQVLEMLQGGGQDFVRAACLVRLSETCAQLKKYQSALDYADEGLLLTRAVRHEQLEAVALRARGDALFATGLAEQADQHWHEALDICRHLGFQAEADSVERRIASGYPLA
ncbi:BTAD domain-containing putative transcriptional regulator [Streptomyces sp. YS415]|uniref:AfsR/SARP family transcriptional regulator n=1 Tax=Streptomyces sp. YS415 TaxID=2944806 RepID=UPI00202089D8|nr:BTAD domain-containing putative transcriptional regulator [Streptomyces sp. YS415]MCL7425432.1 NB-ARC domain-containing protein [Streptomyces sp. YS415]